MTKQSNSAGRKVKPLILCIRYESIFSFETLLECDPQISRTPLQRYSSALWLGGASRCMKVLLKQRFVVLYKVSLTASSLQKIFDSFVQKAFADGVMNGMQVAIDASNKFFWFSWGPNQTFMPIIGSNYLLLPLMA